MKSPQQTPARLRYFFARFKPLAQFKFWGPPSLIALSALLIWQYWNHREWLGGSLSGSLPQTSEGEIPGGNLLDDPLERLAVDQPDPSLGNGSQADLLLPPLASPLNPLGPGTDKQANNGKSEKKSLENPLAQLNQPLESQAKSSSPQIFAPLMPSLNNSQTPDLLKPFAPAPAPAPSRPLEVSPLNPISVRENPLGKAMEQLSPAPSNPVGGELARPNQGTVSQPQPLTPNYGASPIPAQQPGAAYSPPYYGQAPAQAPTYPGTYYPNAQPWANTYQAPSQNPNYGYGSQPAPPNQVNQPGYNGAPAPNRPQQAGSPFDASNYRF